MIKGIQKLFLCVSAFFFATVGAYAVDYPFSLTTVEIESGYEFTFDLSAAGTFYIDCGTDGTLSGAGVSGATVSRSTNDNMTYSCTYSSDGAKTVRFGGVATGYEEYVPTIAFYYDYSVASISGDLSAVFPTLANSNPYFYYTFYGASLTEIPEDLFSHITTGADYMFDSTFYNCTSLTEIPEKLFSHITSGADGMFYSTFNGCTGLTSIPEKLFSHITSSAASMFDSTFSNCTSLTEIPENLFSYITSGAGGMFNGTFSNCTSLTEIPENLFSYITSGAGSMFSWTFSGCTGLTKIPKNLFSHITSGGASIFNGTFYGCSGLTEIPEDLFSFGGNNVSGQVNMFYNTFSNCTSLTEIPENLFSHITSGANYMFNGTFQGCTGLTSIPANLFSFGNNNVDGQLSMFNLTFSGCTGLTSIPSGLFSHITSDARSMFVTTFQGCTGLTGYIPPSLFSGLMANGSPYTTSMMTNTFNNTGSLATTCPEGKEQYITGYEDYWNGHVACGDPITCSSGTYLPANSTQCAACPSGSTCNGGTYGLNAIVAQGVTLTVSYSCGTGTGDAPTSANVTSSESFTPAANPCTPPNGKYFAGWLVNGTEDVKIPGVSFLWPYVTNKTLTAQYQTAKFSVTTTNLSENDTITFTLSAAGNFIVDCGLGGALSGTGVSGFSTISRSTATRPGDTYSCTYSTGGTKTISFDGTATKYYYNSTSGNGQAIGFNTESNTLLASISGDLSAVFPTLGTNGTYDSPGFLYTFQGCTGLTSIPENLFSHLTISAHSHMFYQTFNGCTGLTSIPENLFSFGGNNVSGNIYTFYGTFGGCTGLTSIPAGLFSHVTSGRDVFHATFAGCTGLTSIPESLFSNITSENFHTTFSGCTGLTSIPANLFSNVTSGGFNATFQYCTGLTSIPANLFSNVISGSFNATFQHCTGLTSIPENLFSFGGNNVSGGNYMFSDTFKGCTRLTSIPENLFSRVVSAAGSWMFSGTFAACTSLTGYIPPSLFSGLIANGSPYATNMMATIFSNTGSLATTCPADKKQYITGYESYWNGHVACGEPITCSAGTYLPANSTQCAACPSGSTCTGGTYGFNAIAAQGIGPYVSYSCGLGTGNAPADVTVTSGGSFTPAANTCTAPNGKHFNGWLVSVTSDIKQPGVEFTWNYSGNKKLTAQYAANQITVNFDDTPMTCNYGSTFVPPTPTARTGYVFVGWNLKNCFADLDTSTTPTVYASRIYDGTRWCLTNGSGNAAACENDASMFADISTDEWKADIGDGWIYGTSKCSETGAESQPSYPSGLYCYCGAKRYVTNNANMCDIAESYVTWVPDTTNNTGSSSTCETTCASHCATLFRSSSIFRRKIYNQ